MRTIIAVVLGVLALLALLAVLVAVVGTVLSLIRRRPLRRPLGVMLVFGLVFVVTSLGALFALGSGEQAQVRDDEQLRQEEREQPEPGLPATIPGMLGDEVVSAFERNGLECTPHVPQEGGRLLSTCTSEDNPDLQLLYEGEILGSGPRQPVEGVEARVSMTSDGGDLEMASKGFFGMLGAVLEYEGSNSDEAFTFVSENMSTTDEQSLVIGSAKWGLISTEESKTLEITPAP
jgi:hypothetical protein